MFALFAALLGAIGGFVVGSFEIFNCIRDLPLLG